MTNIQAIDLLKDLEQCLDDYCELNDEGKTAFRMAIEALEVFGNSEQLPSAQPDIIRCKDCKHKPSGSGVNHDISFPDEVCPCQCEDDYWYSWMPKDNWFCGSGERRE